MEKEYTYSGFNKFITKLFITIKELFCPTIVMNACLHYSFGKLVHRNWGDDINIFLFEQIFKKAIIPLYFSPLSMRYKKTNYLMIGSTITLLTNHKSIIWGAGVIDPEDNLPAIPQKVLAVRGPLTRKYLIKNGIDCPPIYGDPAMLFSKIYQPKIKRKYKIGIIAHYVDYKSPILNHFRDNGEVLFIRTENYTNWRDFIDGICSCEYIISSSLHGLIMAETYGVPNLWMEINPLMGGHFKFHDFFLSIGIDRLSPYKVTKHTKITDIVKEINQNYKQGKIDLSGLISSCPFKLYIND